jgi:hypothetical protein
MTEDFRFTYLEEMRASFGKIRELGERALAQVRDDEFLRVVDPEANSIAALLRHVTGNLRSRWTDFLTTDGEKPDRDRDAEFEPTPADTRQTLMTDWERGWRVFAQTLESLTPEDLDRTITIRGKPHSVLRAITIAHTHYSLHIGQIVFLAKHFRSAGWTPLSTPRRPRPSPAPPR